MSGQCVGAATDCNDGNACTDDACDAHTGSCAHTANAAACEDGNKCSVGDVCAEGTCTAGETRSCDDGNLCTTDSCSAPSGVCQHVATGENGNGETCGNGLDDDCDGAIDELCPPMDPAVRDVVLKHTLPLADNCGGWAAFVVRKGALVYVEGFGEVNHDSWMLLASLSKTVMVALSLQLAEDGKLDLDKPIMDIFAADASLQALYKTILTTDHQDKLTARHLLSHRGGLAANGFGSINMCILPPDTATIYSNVGYQVLFDVVRAAGGDTLPALVKRYVGDPADADGLYFPDGRYSASSFGNATPYGFAKAIAALVSGQLVGVPYWPNEAFTNYGGGGMGLRLQLGNVGGGRVGIQDGIYSPTRNALTIWDGTRDAIGLLCYAAPGKTAPVNMRSYSWSAMVEIQTTLP